ncbi:YicC/YloC family endoribonuclease [Kurthia huakuii]|uniref:YicC/YloC family endoribonuclease n=1 Tax=Kurthia huakuii TaxID=1421019 RepID=UPI0004972036|nr:YicC/YloC family endoribonuclease [Kurthia huakuii]
MVRSMTGFGRGVTQTEHFQLTVEIRSVNHRFLEISSRFPKEWMEAELAAKKMLQARLSRGKVDVSVFVNENQQHEQRMVINWPLVNAYKAARKELAAVVPLKEQWDMSELLKLEGALTVEAAQLPHEEVIEAVNDAVSEALDNLIAMREREGIVLHEVMCGFKQELVEQIECIRAVSGDAVVKYREKLLLRIKEVTDSAIVDERILTEVAVFAEKIDIAEELDRLNSHLKQLDETLVEDSSIGRKLDFLLQEIHRETNTIGSKNQSSEAFVAVVQMKSVLEKMREQVQNIE